FLFRTGELPDDIADLESIDPALKGAMRDPMLAGPSLQDPDPENCFKWLGAWPERSLQPAIPLAHSRQGDRFGGFFLLMSDGSVHRVDKEHLDAEVKRANEDPETPSRYSSDTPQTIADAIRALAVKE
ncbi:MAG: hypothetical protein KDB07_08385, partial [Planctomycetes bacterium]|nr:hypothetical protein [Planctomycetota bacterium]